MQNTQSAAQIRNEKEIFIEPYRITMAVDPPPQENRPNISPLWGNIGNVKATNGVKLQLATPC